MARAGEWERAVLHGQVPEHPTSQAAGVQHFAMDAAEDVGEVPAAGRPAPLLEVLPQERVQQRIVEQIVDPVPWVPLLHDVVPQTVEQLVDFLSPRFPRCRAGYRSAQHRVSTSRCSHSPQCAADGGTAGGSADVRFLFFVIAADCGAAR